MQQVADKTFSTVANPSSRHLAGKHLGNKHLEVHYQIHSPLFCIEESVPKTYAECPRIYEEVHSIVICGYL